MGTENVRMLHFWGDYLKGDFSHNRLCLCMRLKLYYSGSDCCQIWLRLSFKLLIHYIITTTIVKISPATKIWHCYFSCLCSHANQLWLKLQMWADLAESSALVPLHKQTKKKKSFLSLPLCAHIKQGVKHWALEVRPGELVNFEQLLPTRLDVIMLNESKPGPPIQQTETYVKRASMRKQNKLCTHTVLAAMQPHII